MAEADQSLLEAERQGHEPRDVSITGVLWVVLIFMSSIGLSAAAVGGLVWLFNVSTERPVVSPLERTEVLPPEPRLESRPAQTLVEIRRREDDLLESYGWVDRETGIAHIPIEEAMRLLAERGWAPPAETEDPWPLLPQERQR